MIKHITTKDFIDKYKGVLVQTGVGIAKCYAAKKISEHTSNDIASTVLYISAFSDFMFSGLRYMINSIAGEINYTNYHGRKNMEHSFMNPRLPTFTEKIILYDFPKFIYRTSNRTKNR